MRKNSQSKLWWLLLACGLLCCVLLLSQRLSAEWHDRQACGAMSLADLTVLAEESGLPIETWRETLEEAGVCYFLEEQEAFVLPEQANPVPLLPLALVENHQRTGVNLPEGESLDFYQGPLVKTLLLYEDYVNRGEEGDAQEIENLLFRAVTDRGMRLLLLPPFRTEAGELILDPAVYTDCLSGLSQRLAARGIEFGEGFSCMDAPPLQPLRLLGAGVLPVLLGTWLLCLLPPFRGRQGQVAAAAMSLLAVLLLLRAELAQQLLLFASAVLFPCAAAYGLSRLPEREPPWLAKRPFVWAAVLLMAAVLAWSLLGGLTVAALLSSRSYLMGAKVFVGVKAALLLPLLFAGLVLLWRLRGPLGRLEAKNWLRLALAAALLCGVVSVYLIRSGDWQISGLETAVRNGMEYLFYARPRTKELFLAAPCVPLFLWACRREMPLVGLLCGVGACLECVSVVNTFCHGVAPIHVSLLRTLPSAGIGLGIGLLIAGLLDQGITRWQRTHPTIDQAS